MTLEPLSRFNRQSVRIYSVKKGDRGFAYSEADGLMKVGIRYEGLACGNYFFSRVLKNGC